MPPRERPQGSIIVNEIGHLQFKAHVKIGEEWVYVGIYKSESLARVACSKEFVARSEPKEFLPRPKLKKSLSVVDPITGIVSVQEVYFAAEVDSIIRHLEANILKSLKLPIGERQELWVKK